MNPPGERARDRSSRERDRDRPADPGATCRSPEACTGTRLARQRSLATAREWHGLRSSPCTRPHRRSQPLPCRRASPPVARRTVALLAAGTARARRCVPSGVTARSGRGVSTRKVRRPVSSFETSTVVMSGDPGSSPRPSTKVVPFVVGAFGEPLAAGANPATSTRADPSTKRSPVITRLKGNAAGSAASRC